MKRTGKGLLITAGLFGGMSVITTSAAMALFTDAQASQFNAFDAGTIELTANSPSALLTAAGMMPGDSITKSLEISNRGTSSLRYRVSSSSKDAEGPDGQGQGESRGEGQGLGAQLVLTVRTIDETTPGPGAECDDLDGEELYAGPLDQRGAKVTNEPIGAGQHDRSDQTDIVTIDHRLLAASTSETLCFQVSLPLDTSNRFQLASTTAVITFDTEQVVRD